MIEFKKFSIIVYVLFIFLYNVFMKTYSISIHKWISIPDKSEGWKIVTEDAYIGNEDDGYQRQLIAIVYDEVLADYICALHNCERMSP